MAVASMTRGWSDGVSFIFLEVNFDIQFFALRNLHRV